MDQIVIRDIAKADLSAMRLYDRLAEKSGFIVYRKVW